MSIRDSGTAVPGSGVNNRSHPAGKGGPTATSDIGVFVVQYQRLVELLAPLSVVGNATLYVLRWEHYLLTLTVLVVLCVLFYYPVLLLTVLTILCILLMATGKYYSQCKTLTILKLKAREMPKVDVLDQDGQAMRQYRKEQKNSHKVLITYVEIMKSAEAYIVRLSKALEYLYSIILWKSPEVSLCVTVLLCVLLVLLCVVYLRVLIACLPIIVLCSNRHFLRRTIELWKKVLLFLYNNTRLRRPKLTKQQSKEKSPSDSGPRRDSNLSNTVTSGLLTEREAVANGSAVYDHSTESTIVASTGTSTDSEDTSSSRQARRANEQAAGAKSENGRRLLSSTTSLVNSGQSGDKEGGANRGSPKPFISNKGYCSQCNVSFAKLLKRKHDCNYCGQTFCGSCTVKVKRALLGATSPAAFEESVRVCQPCKMNLPVNLTSSGASSTNIT